ncbi:MAG: hypothetical protein ACXW3L_10350, partial [Limisphaerales bacterium]
MAAISFLKVGIAAGAETLAAGCGEGVFPRRLINRAGLYAREETEAKEERFEQASKGSKEARGYEGSQGS